MQTLKHIFFTIITLMALAILVSAWYIIVALTAVTVVWYIVKYYIQIRREWDEA